MIITSKKERDKILVTLESLTRQLELFNKHMPILEALLSSAREGQESVQSILDDLSAKAGRSADANEKFVRRLEEFLGLKLTIDREKLDLEKKLIEENTPTEDDLRY